MIAVEILNAEVHEGSAETVMDRPTSFCRHPFSQQLDSPTHPPPEKPTHGANGPKTELTEKIIAP
jgi:hypothetical protein